MKKSRDKLPPPQKPNAILSLQSMPHLPSHSEQFRSQHVLVQRGTGSVQDLLLVKGRSSRFYHRMPKRVLKSGDTPTTVFGIRYFTLVPPNTEVENKVITTRKKKRKIKHWALGKSKEIGFFPHMYLIKQHIFDSVLLI